MSDPEEPPGRRRPPRRRPRRLLIDLTPLRRSCDFRRLVSGELVSVLGTQLTAVAVPYQVYQLTRSSLAVGLVSLAQLFPLIAGSLLGGSAVDAMDRRRVLMAAQVLMAGCSAGPAAGGGGNPLRVLAGRGELRGGAGGHLPGVLAAGRPGPARRRGLRRRHLRGVPQHDHPAFRAGHAAGTAVGPADRRGHRGPRLGDLESGAVASAFGDTVSVVSGGLACIAGALVLARLLPGFRRQRMDAWHEEHMPAAA